MTFVFTHIYMAHSPINVLKYFYLDKKKIVDKNCKYVSPKCFSIGYKNRSYQKCYHNSKFIQVLCNLIYDLSCQVSLNLFT